jgi:hypothetical protein
MERANVVRWLSLILVAVIFLAGPSGSAQRGAGRGQAAGGGTSTPLNAYAYADCGPANTPTVQIVVVTGPIPATIPAAAPQPSVKITLNGPPDRLTATQQSITVSADAAKGGPNALMMSCPVVGDCVPAESGTVSVQRREDGALTGNYQATWTGTPARMGRFTAAWRESGKKCG